MSHDPQSETEAPGPQNPWGHPVCMRLSWTTVGVENSGSNTHNGLLIQNCPFQVALFPELGCHQQSDLGAHKTLTLWSLALGQKLS